MDVAGNQELIAALPAAIDMINSHLSDMYHLESQRNAALREQDGASSPGKVLVFCETGNERSAALVTAYIMAMYSWNLIKSLQLVQSLRFAVSIDDTTRNYLETYHCILQAKRDVIQQQSNIHAIDAAASSNTHSDSLIKPQNSKRTLDDTYEDDDVAMDNNDLDRFEKREGAAPFQV